MGGEYPGHYPGCGDNVSVDVGIVFASEFPLPRSYGDALARIVREKMHNPDLQVRVACVAAGWAEPVDGP